MGEEGRSPGRIREGEGVQKESKAFHKYAEWEDLGSHPRMAGKTNVRFLLPIIYLTIM